MQTAHPSTNTANTVGLKRYQSSSFLRYGNNPCDICDGKDKGCMVHEQGHIIICTRQPVGAYKERDHQGIGRVYYHRYGGSTSPVQSRPKGEVFEQETRLAPNKTLHTQYVQLKKKWPLEPHQRAYLDSQGIMDHSRWSNLPKAPKGQLRLVGHWPKGVPGIYHKGEDAYLNVFNYGLICWQYNAEGEITGGEIRLAEECKQEIYDRKVKRISEDKDLSENQKSSQLAKLAEDFEDRKGKSVYRPLVSSAPWQGGTAPKNAYSVWINHDSDEVWITEGLKKGQVLFEQKGVNVIAVRGVANYGQVVAPLGALVAKVKKLRSVVVAMDADKDTNPAVKHANDGLIQLMIEQQVLEVKEAFWDASEKGIDDALNAEIEIEVRSKHNQVFMELQQGRELLAETYYNLIRQDKAGFNLIKASAGVGKTWALIDALNRLDAEGWLTVEDEKGNPKYARIVMAFDNNLLVKEMWPLFNFQPAILEGRNESEDSQFYCANKSTIDDIAAAGLNTQKYGCVKCPVRAWCTENAYLGTVEMVLRSRFIITNKAAMMNRSNRLDDVDILILDEGIRHHIQDEMTATVDDLRLYQIGLGDAIHAYETELNELIGYDKQTSARIERQVELKSLLAKCKKQEIMLPEYIDMLRQEPPESPVRIFPDFSDIDLPGFIMLPSEGCEYPGSDDQFGFRKCWIKPLFSENVKAVWHMPDNTLLIKCIDKHLVDRMNDMNVINMDATPIEAYLRLFHQVNTVDVPVQENTIIHSILDKKYAKTQLIKNPEYEAELTHAVTKLFEKHQGNAVVLTSKLFAEHLMEQGVQEDSVGWYGKDTRGSNKWQKVAAVIIAGPYIENMEAVSRDIAVLKMVGVETDMDELQQQISSAETIQAIARGRGVSRTKEEPLHVYKLTSHKIKGVKEDVTYANIYDLLDGITASQRSSRSPEDVRRSRQAALDFIYQKPVGQFQQKTVSQGQYKCEQVGEADGGGADFEKAASNPVIAENDTPSESLYNKYICRDRWGIIFEKLNQQPVSYLTDLFNSLRMDCLTARNISHKIWIAFLDALHDGITSINDLVEHLGKSRATVMRLRNAFVSMVGPLFDETPYVEDKTQAEAIAAFAIENNFDSLVAEARKAVPDHRIFIHAKERNLLGVEEIRKAIEMLEKFPEPAQHEEGVEWYWLCVFNHMKRGLYNHIARRRPLIMLQYFLSELDKEMAHGNTEEIGRGAA